MRIGFRWENQKEINQWEVLDIGGRIILKWILENVAEDRNQWQAFGDTVMNLRVS
jgi:hypothetical protein